MFVRVLLSVILLVKLSVCETTTEYNDSMPLTCTDNITDCTTITETQEETTTSKSLTSEICTICNCTENVVDCTKRNIRKPFKIQDWEGLKVYKPITVDLSQNHLTSFTRISDLPLQTLNLSNCGIETIEDGSFIYLPELVTLDLSRNRITSHKLSRRVFVGPVTKEKGIQSFKRIQYLSLASNAIHSLPQDIFIFLINLSILDLSGNPLVFLDQVTMGALTDLVNLKALYMSNCELTSLPEGLFRRHRLLKLDISGNRFTTVPAVLSEARSLIYLNFGGNDVKVLEGDNAIRNLTKLQDLRLNRNPKLRRINAYALACLTNLVTLDISYNLRLSYIDPNFLTYNEQGIDEYPIIKELYLNNNNLTSIDSSYLHRWDKLSTVDVTNNPYACDCRNQWLLDVLVPRIGRLTNQTEDMICKWPLEMRGLSFAQLHRSTKTLVCVEEDDADLPLSNLGITLGIMIGIFVTFPMVLIIILLWRKGYFARCRTKKVMDEYDEETSAF